MARLPLAAALFLGAGLLVAASGERGPYFVLVVLALEAGVVMLARPEVGLPLVFLTAPLDVFFLQVFGVRLKSFQIISLVVLAGWGGQVLVARRPLRWSPLAIPLLLLTATYLLSFLLHSQYLYLGLPLFLLELWFVAIVLLVANFSERPDILRACLWAMVISGTGVAVYGVIEALGFYRDASVTATYQAILHGGRPFATFTEPDFLGAYLMGTFLLLLPFLGSRRWPLWLMVLLGLPMLAAIVLVLVRAAWLGLLGGLAAYAWARWRQRGSGDPASFARGWAGLLAAAAVAALAVSWLAPSALGAAEVRARNLLAIVEPENPSETRLNEVREAAAAALDSPLSGHGIGTYGVLTRYGATVAADRGQERSGVVGSGAVLGLMFDQGVLGVAAFALLLAVLFWRLNRALPLADAKMSPYVQGAFASLSGLAVSALVNNLFYFGFFWLIIALAAALADAVLQGSASPEPRAADATAGGAP